MIGRKKKDEERTIVTTKQELNAAIKRGEPLIEVKGDLIKQIKWVERLSPVKIAALVALLASLAIPNPMSPISMAAVASMPAVADLTGMEIATIIFASGLSVSLILSLLRGYDVKIGSGDKSLLLTKK